MSVPVQLDIEGPAFERPVEPVWPFEGLPRQHFGCISLTIFISFCLINVVGANYPVTTFGIKYRHIL